MRHYGKYLDLNMMVLTKGRERTEEQYRALFEAAGFTLLRVVSTRSELSIIEGRPALRIHSAGGSRKSGFRETPALQAHHTSV